jgi:hypothetical protein
MGGGGDGDMSFLLAQKEKTLAFYWCKSRCSVYCCATFYWWRVWAFYWPRGQTLAFYWHKHLGAVFTAMLLFTGRPHVSSEDFRQFFLPLQFLLLPPTMLHGPIT